jgi:carbonic anhydrase/acetyltransferase-like protein (isoleucine patch superfamily)
MIMGRPAQVTRALTPDERTKYANHYKSYVGYKNQYLAMES